MIYLGNSKWRRGRGRTGVNFPQSFRHCDDMTWHSLILLSHTRQSVTSVFLSIFSYCVTPHTRHPSRQIIGEPAGRLYNIPVTTHYLHVITTAWKCSVCWVLMLSCPSILNVAFTFCFKATCWNLSNINNNLICQFNQSYWAFIILMRIRFQSCAAQCELWRVIHLQ